jgi:hypothetical protein
MSAVRPLRQDRGATILRLVLPVSGVRATVQAPTGAEELLLAEGRPSDPALALALVRRIARADDPMDWGMLPVHDIDTLIVRLRQAQIGDHVMTDIACTRPGCGQRVDMSFGLGDYLMHNRPRQPRGRSWRAEPCADAAGWFQLAGDAGAVPFRLPTIGDQIEVAGAADASTALAARCIRTDALPVRLSRRIEAAMEALAPPLAGPLQGRCPECSATIEAWFDARTYCLTELCARTRFVFDDIHLLAERYHWSERAILRLPRTRRERYAERARLAGAA